MVAVVSRTSVERFQLIAESLLKKHYGISLKEAGLHNEMIVAELIKKGTRPFQVIAKRAARIGLARIDLGNGGCPELALTDKDEEIAIFNLPNPSLVHASEINDYVIAMNMYEAFAGEVKSACFGNKKFTKSVYKPNVRSAAWFDKMVELKRPMLTDWEREDGRFSMLKERLSAVCSDCGECAGKAPLGKCLSGVFVSA